MGAGRTRPCHRRISAPLLFAGEQGTVYIRQIAQTALAVNRTAAVAPHLSYGPGSGGTGKMIRAL